jgi:hypothetical protein
MGQVIQEPQEIKLVKVAQPKAVSESYPLFSLKFFNFQNTYYLKQVKKKKKNARVGFAREDDNEDNELDISGNNTSVEYEDHKRDSIETPVRMPQQSPISSTSKSSLATQIQPSTIRNNFEESTTIVQTDITSPDLHTE